MVPRPQCSWRVQVCCWVCGPSDWGPIVERVCQAACPGWWKPQPQSRGWGPPMMQSLVSLSAPTSLPLLPFPLFSDCFSWSASCPVFLSCSPCLVLTLCPLLYLLPSAPCSSVPFLLSIFSSVHTPLSFPPLFSFPSFHSHSVYSASVPSLLLTPLYLLPVCSLPPLPIPHQRPQG